MIIKFKLYESENSVNLKRYAIWHWTHNDDYDIIEITEIENTKFWSRDIYCYYDNENELNFVNSHKKESSNIFTKNVIFSSDNLKECLEELETILAAKKYNL